MMMKILLCVIHMVHIMTSLYLNVQQGFDLGLTTIDGLFDPNSGLPLVIERKDNKLLSK